MIPDNVNWEPGTLLQVNERFMTSPDPRDRKGPSIWNYEDEIVWILPMHPDDDWVHDLAYVKLLTIRGVSFAWKPFIKDRVIDLAAR